MNEENACDHKVDAAMVEGPVENRSRKEVRETIRKMKQEKAAGLSEITTEMIVAGGRIANKFWIKRESWMNGKPALCCQFLREKEV